MRTISRRLFTDWAAPLTIANCPRRRPSDSNLHGNRTHLQSSRIRTRACPSIARRLGPAMRTAIFSARPTRYPYAPERTYTPPDAPLARFKAAAGDPGADTCGTGQCQLPRARQHGHRRCHRAERGQYRGVANADDSFSERDFEKLHRQGCSRRALQFRQASGRHARHG